MSFHTATNVDPDGFVHIVGDNFTLHSGDSILLEQWQFIEQDLLDIINGKITVDPVLPRDITGLNFSTIISNRGEDVARDLDKIIVELRLRLGELEDSIGTVVNSLTAGDGLDNSGTAADPILDVVFGLTSGTVAAGDHVHATLPSADEKDALTGTNGTPSSTNPYVTDSDPRLIGGAGISPASFNPTVTFTGESVFTFPSTPVLTTTVEMSVNSVLQENGVDFTVSGTTLTWISTDFLLTPGDFVYVAYFD